MPTDLIDTLRALESEYPGMPPVVQKTDLTEINRIRTALGMPAVDSRLVPVGGVADTPPRPKPTKPAPDHSRAREIYAAYTRKRDELDRHREYADAVVRATGGPGMTPVMPLATMGTGGGPLLCDECRRPIILEGRRFNRVAADAAWRANPDPAWRSYISGGVVVEIAVNGTLRIYHGYTYRPNDCCSVAKRAADAAEREFRSARDIATDKLVLAFLADEFPDAGAGERFHLLNEILNTVYDFDPGVGVNQPG